jgi:hypothetical protein
MTKAMGVALAIALLAGTTGARAEEAPLARTTTVGQPVKLRNHVKLNSACVGSPPTITFNTKPAHGTVDIKPDRFIMGKGYKSGTVESCAGTPVDGIAIWYTPAPGYKGTDQIGWTADFGGNGRHNRVDNYIATVTVQ